MLSLIPWFKLEAWPIPFPFLGTLDIQPFGLLVATGIIIGSRVAEWRGEKTGVPRHAVSDFLVTTILIGLLSAMVLNMVFYEPTKIVSMFKGEFSYPGLSSFGGFIGGTFAALWFRSRHRMSIFVLGDIFCYAFPTAWFFGRMGCFTVHDHPGLVSDFFLAVDNYNLRGQPRHDLGLYEVIWSAVVAGLFWWLAKKPRPRGYFMALCPLLYAPVRFCLDFLRETPDFGGDVRYGGLTPGQYASIVMLVVALAVTARVRRGPEPELYLDGAPEPAPAKASARPAPKRRKRK
jgi:phosphatidylglycerol:prolipoprotein diacylglycerol transferase